MNFGVLRKRGQRWQAQVRCKCRTPISRNFKAEALVWARAQELEADQGRPQVHKTLGGITVADIVTRCCDETGPANATPTARRLPSMRSCVTGPTGREIAISCPLELPLTLQYLFLQFRSALLFYRQEADALDAGEKAIAALAKSCAAIELTQDLGAPILEGYVRGCAPQYPSGVHEPSCYQRMYIDTLVTAKRSDRRLYL